MEYKNMFPRGEELKSPNFTGRVWLEMISERDEQFNCPIGNVTFEPSCRNSWHKHPGGQILLCLSGEGYYAERDGKIRKLLPGDVVRIAQNVEHWHGATPDSWFSHLSIETNTAAGAAVWLEPVTDAQYGAKREQYYEKNRLENINQYSVVFISAPIWYGGPAMIMQTFYEAYPLLAGKTLIPFGTHEESGTASLAPVLKRYFPNSAIK